MSPSIFPCTKENYGFARTPRGLFSEITRSIRNRFASFRDDPIARRHVTIIISYICMCVCTYLLHYTTDRKVEIPRSTGHVSTSGRLHTISYYYINLKYFRYDIKIVIFKYSRLQLNLDFCASVRILHGIRVRLLILKP